MRFSKKSATICAFILGVVILTGAAFADTMIGSGFNSLKNSVKETTAKLTGDVDNFAANMAITAKVDGVTFAESIIDTKFDIAGQAEETNEAYLENGKIREQYSYSDENQNIYKNSNDDTYNVYQKLKSDSNRNAIVNPFEKEQVKDLEKILDALVGSLGDVIQVEESSGKKLYTGNLSESQIPPLVNALSSFVFKYNVLDERNAKNMDVPYPKTNIYLISASGKAMENEE